jgi:hypothetical protein
MIRRLSDDDIGRGRHRRHRDRNGRVVFPHATPARVGGGPLCWEKEAKFVLDQGLAVDVLADPAPEPAPRALSRPAR